MPDKDRTPVAVATPATPAPGVPGAPAANGAAVPPKRSPGHRGADVKDTVAEMAAKAHEISLEAGSKMAAAMKEVINAAAGLTGFAIESARDLVQFMVRRGQMTQDEADKLIREAEDFQSKRKGSGSAKAASLASVKKPASAAKPASRPAAKKQAAKKPVAKKPAAKKPAAKKAAAKSHSPKKAAAKAPARKGSSGKSAAKRSSGSKAGAKSGRKK